MGHGGFFSAPSIFYAYTFRAFTIKVVFFSALFRFTITQFCSNSFFRFPVFSLHLFFKLHSSPFLRSLIGFLKMSSPFQSTRAAFHMSVMGASYVKPAEDPGLKRDDSFSLLVNVDGTHLVCILPRFCGCADSATSILQRQIHSNSLAHDNSCDLTAKCTCFILEEMQCDVYPYTFHATKRCRPRLQMCTSLAYTRETVKQ